MRDLLNMYKKLKLINEDRDANTAHGKNVAITDCHESILEYQWTFKSLHYTPLLYVYIGIDSSNKKCINDHFASRSIYRNSTMFHAAGFYETAVFLFDFGEY